MDNGSTDPFPWAAQDPKLFISAFRRTVELSRQNNDTYVKWVWSPNGGKPNIAMRYYPGDDVVDVLGTTLLYDRYWWGSYIPTFDDMAKTRLWEEAYGKPVWITEFGLGNADPAFQRHLLMESMSQFEEYGYDALIYINIVDPHNDGPKYNFKDVQVLSDILKIGLSDQRYTSLRETARLR
jgi:hypothetical protein